MGEQIKYVVVCDCTGRREPVALIDDGRPVGGSVTVRGVGDEDTAAVFAVADGGDNAAYGKVAKSWAERGVTETIWADGHSTWAIRCMACGQQVQPSDKNLLDIADSVAAARDQLPVRVADPSEAATSFIGRHELPLRALTRILAR